jgi:hypothetical protein
MTKAANLSDSGKHTNSQNEPRRADSCRSQSRTDIADALAKKHDNSLDHAPDRITRTSPA